MAHIPILCFSLNSAGFVAPQESPLDFPGAPCTMISAGHCTQTITLAKFCRKIRGWTAPAGTETDKPARTCRWQTAPDHHAFQGSGRAILHFVKPNSRRAKAANVDGLIVHGRFPFLICRYHQAVLKHRMNGEP